MCPLASRPACPTPAEPVCRLGLVCSRRPQGSPEKMQLLQQAQNARRALHFCFPAGVSEAGPHTSSCIYSSLPTTAEVLYTHHCQPRGEAAVGPLLSAAELGRPSRGAHTGVRVCNRFARCLFLAEQRVKQLSSLQRTSGDAGWAVAFCIWEFV